MLRAGKTVADLCDLADPVERRLMNDYGAIFVADESIVPPPRCMFESAAQAVAFQAQAGSADAEFAGVLIELQPAALSALLLARAAAQDEGLEITPRGGAEAARRTFNDTLRLWESRFQPALEHWLAQGKLTAQECARLRQLPLKAQVAAVLELEARRIYFSKDFSKSILYSPGASQHLFMLAFDVKEFQNARVREILAAHGWFQTVQSDLPHFTFLGLAEKELPARGLVAVYSGGQKFWIPKI